MFFTDTCLLPPDHHISDVSRALFRGYFQTSFPLAVSAESDIIHVYMRTRNHKRQGATFRMFS